MKNQYYTQFEVRWSDLDPNRHLANSSYMKYGSHLRIKFLNEHGFSQQRFAEEKVGPVVFTESFHFFKEIMPNEMVTVTLEMNAASENMMFFKMAHNYYKEDGSHAAYCELYGSWISLERRRLVVPPEGLVNALNQMPKSEDYHLLTKEELKKARRSPRSPLEVPNPKGEL